MKAAVVHDFTQNLASRMSPDPSQDSARFLSRSRPPACVTPISMRHMVTGRSSRACR